MLILSYPISSGRGGGRSLAQPSQHRMLFWFAEDPSSVDCLKRLFKV